jgi:4,5-dihydroxyphthalate decarboxylase
LSDLNLSLAVWDYDRTRALQDGRVKPEGIELTYLPLGMPESFFRMLRHHEFDVSEMSLSWYTRTVFEEVRPFHAIPIFPSRVFRHSSIYVNVHSGISTPQDLVGKRIGCPEYQMTAAVWIKGILADEYGVPVDSVTYHTGGLKEPGRQEMPMQLPSNISVTPVPVERTLSELLYQGEIDALYTAEMPPVFAERSANVARLFPDYEREERAYYGKTGIFPIMHVVVIRADVLERNPWVAQSLTKAFHAAQQYAYRDLYEDTAASKLMLPWLNANVETAREVMGQNFWPYGFDANRETLATFLRYSHEQGLAPRLAEPQELFVPSTLLTSRT